MRFINWLIGVPVWIIIIGALFGICAEIWNYWVKDNEIKGKFVIAICCIAGLISFLLGLVLKIAYYLNL